MDSRDVFLFAFAGAYAIFGSGGATYLVSGEVNPVTQIKSIIEIRVDGPKRMKEELFGENGLADTNKDGRIDFSERFNAYIRMGFDRDKLDPKNLPDPEWNVSYTQLERAVKSYKSEYQ